MANQEHLDKLKQGVQKFNQWREDSPNIQPDLTEANLSKMMLRGYELSDAKMSKADLNGANLSGANLQRADLSEVKLTEAKLNRANLEGTILTSANLSKAKIRGADLSRAVLKKANLTDADFTRSILSTADLTDASKANWVIKDTKLPETKPIDKDAIRVLLVGHIDHGKTTLFTAMTGMRIIETKQLPFSTSGKNYLLIDCNSHHEILEKLDGGDIDALILVITMDGVMPLLRETLNKAKEKKIKHFILYFNEKYDIDDPEMHELTVMEIREKIDSLGYSEDPRKHPLITGSALKAIEGDISHKKTIDQLLEKMAVFSR